MPLTKHIQPGTLTNRKLVGAHFEVHRAWAVYKRTGKYLDFSKEDFFNVHRLIMNEMKRRDMTHNIANDLDRIGIGRGSRQSLKRKIIEAGFRFSEIGSQAEKLTNERANLRTALENNKGERCEYCQYFQSPDQCKIVVGPVSRDQLCDWIQSRGVDDVPRYTVEDKDWLDFGKGMMELQPYQHIVKDIAITPVGPLVMIEDTMKPKPHRFSLTKDFHIEHTSLEHHWTQEEVDRIIQRGD